MQEEISFSAKKMTKGKLPFVIRKYNGQSISADIKFYSCCFGDLTVALNILIDIYDDIRCFAIEFRN